MFIIYIKSIVGPKKKKNFYEVPGHRHSGDSVSMILPGQCSCRGQVFMWKSLLMLYLQ